MKHYTIIITTAKGRTEMSGLFSSSFDAVIEGMDQLNDEPGRVSAKPA
jgi:hypothetical protein